MRLWRDLGAAVLGATLLLAACAPAGAGSGPSTAGSQQSTGPKRAVTAIRGIVKFVPTSLNAGGGGRIDGNTEINGLANAGLSVEVWPDASRVPVLAEALPTVENGLWKVMPDGKMETTWKLRPGVQWHDGTPVTAADFVFTSTLAQDREMPWLPDPFYQYVEKVEAADPTSVRVTWKSTSSSSASPSRSIAQLARMIRSTGTSSHSSFGTPTIPARPPA